MKKLFGYIRNENGSQIIEFFAVFPMVVFALLFIWQMALVAYTVVVAEASARDGARIASVGGDFTSAVESSAYGLDVSASKKESTGAYGKEVTVKVVAKIPTVKIPFVGNLDLDVDADATMPLEDEDG